MKVYGLPEGLDYQNDMARATNSVEPIQMLRHLFWVYHKSPKILDTRKVAALILKVEHCCFTIEGKQCRS